MRFSDFTSTCRLANLENPRYLLTKQAYICRKVQLKQSENKQGLTRLVLFTLLCSLTAYTFLRSFLVDFTWDEAATWLSYVRFGYWQPGEAGFLDANNHLLNTLFMVTLNNMLGSDVWMLRLHTLFFAAIYMLGSYFLVKKIPDARQQVIAFILITAHPYLLDFFSLARGYGIGMACMMASWFSLYTYVQKPSIPKLLTIILCSMLSVLAYFGQLNMAIGLWSALILHHLYQWKLNKSSLRCAMVANMTLLFPAGLFLIWLVPLLWKMQDSGNFYAGGDAGFYQDTLKTLAVNIGYGKWGDSPISLTIVVCVGIILAYWFFSCIRMVRKKIVPDPQQLFPVLIWLMLLLAFSSLIIQHHVLGTPYPRDRMAVIFLPGLMICLAWIFPQWKFKLSQTIFSYTLATLVLFHFLQTMNLHRSFEWRNNAHNLKMFEQLNDIKEFPPCRNKIFVSAGDAFFSVLNYYRITRNWQHVEQVFHDMEQFNAGADYFVMTAEDIQKHSGLPVKMIYTDRTTGNILARNKQVFQNYSGIETWLFRNEYDPNQEIFEVKPAHEFAGEIKIQPFNHDQSKTIQYIRVNIEVFAEKPITRSTGLILSFECPDGTCDYRYFNLYDQLSEKAGNWMPVESIYPVLPELADHSRIKIYLWNNNAQAFLFRNMKAERLCYK
jgi:hypothetical protein